MTVVGTQAKVQVVFRDEDKRPADPGVVTIQVKTPAASTTAYVYGTDAEVTRIATGVYQIAFAVTAAGTWTVQAEGSSSGPIVVDSDTFSATAAAI